MAFTDDRFWVRFTDGYTGPSNTDSDRGYVVELMWGDFPVKSKVILTGEGAGTLEYVTPSQRASAVAALIAD